MQRSECRKVAACVAAMALASAGLLSLPARATAQSDEPSGAVELRPGLLIHPTLDVAYVMTPEGVAAVDISTGAKQWVTSAAAKPLALVGNLLVSQAKPKMAGNRLELVALDVRRGAPARSGVVELPDGVRVSVGESLAGTFSVEARATADSVLLRWRFRPSPRRGSPERVPADAGRGEPADKKEAALAQRPAEKLITGDTLRMSLTTGAVTRQDDSSMPLTPRPRWRLTAAAKIAGAAAATQYESADGRHVLGSQRVADDRVWDKYLWTIYERGSGRRLGEFRTHLSFTPFVVRGSLVLFETTPFRRRGAAQEPAKLRAVSLSGRREVWAVEVREIVYRGPLPP